MNVREAYAYSRTKAGIQRARELMDAPRRLENRLTLLYARMDALRERMAPTYGMLQGSRPSLPGDKTGSLAVKLCDTEREAEQLLHRLSLCRKKRLALIKDLPEGVARDALKLVYLDGMNVLYAAEKLYVDPRQMARYLNAGLSQVAMRLAMGEACADDEMML
ncbi:MAG: hypothetical protein E7326_04290 [Clostridiales bacterium]|nr:hypothetical protein [Clostridiales bacterium]